MPAEGRGAENRVALVTGANRGIGREIVRQLGERGVSVWLTARDREAGEEAVESLRKEGGAVRFLLGAETPIWLATEAPIKVLNAKSPRSTNNRGLVCLSVENLCLLTSAKITSSIL